MTDFVSRLRDTGLVIEGPERQRIADAIEALIDAVRTNLCPRPVNSRREDEIVSAEDCFCSGECGCNNGIALKKAGYVPPATNH